MSGIRTFKDEAGRLWEVYETRGGAAAERIPESTSRFHFRNPENGRTGWIPSATGLADTSDEDLRLILVRADFDDDDDSLA